MPARTDPIILSRENATLGLETDRRNFELFNDPEGAARRRSAMQAQSDADAQRTGPVVDRSLSDPMLEISNRARTQQDYLAEALRQQAYGTGYNPAIEQLRAQTLAAQANQRSLAAGAGGYDAASARREAAWQGSMLGAQSNQQAQALQAQQMAFGRDQYGNFSEAMRGQDLSVRDALQQEAIKQASLEDQQRAQNDAMAQFYLGEQGRVRRGQSSANQNYESQSAANKFGQSNRDEARRAWDREMDRQVEDGVMSAVGAGTAAASTYSTSPTEEKKKRNPYDPGDP